MSKTVRAHLALLIANIIYGLNYYVVKEVVPFALNPYSLSVIRAVGALFFLWIASFFFKRQKIESNDRWKLVFGGILGVTINQTLLIAGLSNTSSVNASIIMTTNPLFVMLIAMFFLKDFVRLKTIIGICLGALGAIMVISSNGSFSISDKTFVGDILILSNAIMYAAYLVWTKPLMEKYDAFTVMIWMFFYGSLFMCVGGGYFVYNTDFSSISLSTLTAIFFIVFGATFLTYLFNIYGLKYVNPTIVSVYIYLQPIIATLLAVFVKNDSLSITKIVAMFLVFAGVYVVSFRSRVIKP